MYLKAISGINTARDRTTLVDLSFHGIGASRKGAVVTNLVALRKGESELRIEWGRRTVCEVIE